MAKSTGGIFRTCENAKALEDIYGEIDRLEKSEVEAVRYVTHRELYFPFLAWGLATLFLALLSRMTIFRRLP